jgi:hypothetical protein
MAWMNMQIVAGLERLGHDAWYFETTSTWPYDPDEGMRVCASRYAVSYLDRVARQFGLDGKWAYRRSYSDNAWLGASQRVAEDVLASADAVFNVAGASRLAEEGLKTGPLIYFGTDPVFHELAYASGDWLVRDIVDAHVASVTYGENIGTPGCAIPPLPNLRARTRQPVLLDEWANDVVPRSTFTTVGNWRQDGRDVAYQGDSFLWSKHHEFRKFIDLPLQIDEDLELATNLSDPSTIVHAIENVVKTMGMDYEDSVELVRNGWKLVAGTDISRIPSTYRDYILKSRGEFTVARDLNVRLKSGWFSERSACYLAAGRPVITQDTGFGNVLPTGEGLFAFSTMDERLAAFDAARSDYNRHSDAARSIASEYFRAETVLSKLIDDLGL